MALPGVDLLREARDASLAKVFVETGTHRGDGLATALEADFEEYYSAELAPFSYGWSSHRFRDQRDKVHLHLGDSVTFLRRLLGQEGGGRGIYGPCVFWLDAHWCGGDGEMDGQDSDLRREAPLLKELAVIGKHRCRHHAILIDDAHNFGTELPPRVVVEDFVRAISPDYEIRYVDGRDFPNDILVATAPPEEVRD